jgi:Domain of unknown function (DUF4129)
VTEPSALEAREEARRILAEDRFHEDDLPRPLARPLDWLGERLEEVFGDLFEGMPGGPAVGWFVLSALVLALGVAIGLALVRHRAPAALARSRKTRNAPPADPSQLERAADAAESAGDLELALRLRFRAGVLRLAQRRILDDPDGVTSGALVRLLRSPDFDRAAAAFDEVVYGRRSPTTEDTRLARAGWHAVLAGGRAR